MIKSNKDLNDIFFFTKYSKFRRIFQLYQIRVITKLPNSEQSYKGKLKTHKYINRQNQSTTGKL
jgi:hypothetical protein